VNLAGELRRLTSEFLVGKSICGLVPESVHVAEFVACQAR
jgi:hypothetical protein